MAEKKLSKRALLKSWFIGINFFNNANTFQRNFGTGFAASMIPILQDLYPDNKQEVIDGMTFYNDKYYITEPSTGMVINAIVAKMEEARANGAEINREDMEAVKSGLMGALAGFGDTIFTSTIRPVGMAIFTPMALSGNILGPLGFYFLGGAARWLNGIFWYKQGIKFGTDALNTLLEGGNEKLRQVMDAMGVLAMFVMGAMAANYVTPKFALQVTIQEAADGLVPEKVATLQSFVDGALPGLLPLTTVLLSYYLMSKKNVSAIKIILGILVISILGALVGLF